MNGTFLYPCVLQVNRHVSSRLASHTPLRYGHYDLRAVADNERKTREREKQRETERIDISLGEAAL